MGKHELTLKEIYSVFATTAWTNTGILALPEDSSLETGNATEFIRMTILSNGHTDVNPRFSLSGYLMIEIYTPAGYGPLRSTQIADILDTFLMNKTVQTTSKGSTQFGVSSIARRGKDTDNNSLTISYYSIPFTYFGIQQ